MLLLLCAPVWSQTRRALVVGIGVQEDKAWGKINGDKDVAYVMEMLKSSGYKQKNISTLMNEKATKAAIVSAFKRLGSSCKEGDMVYVHFSGHGQQMKDLHRDEADGMDECWIPYDAYRKPCAKDRGEKHLTDDEVNALLNSIRDKIGDKGRMLVVIDACHSGDGTRGDDDETVRGVAEVFEAVAARFSELADKMTSGGNAAITRNKERWLTLSACKSDQLNIEMKTPAVGKLTYAIYTLMKDGKAKEANAEWFRALRKFINQNTGSRPQQPVLSGDTERYNITDILSVND